MHMSQYTTEGHSWSFKFTFKNVEFQGTAQKMWNNGVPFFAAQWKQKNDPDPPYSAALYPKVGDPVRWHCDLQTPQDIVDAVGKAIEERVNGAGFDIFSK
jgi:hypothetical protein